MTTSLTLPLRLPSVANLREHWRARAKRAREQRAIVMMAVRSTSTRSELSEDVGVMVHVTRIAPRLLDGHDNLRSACKAVVDGIADALGVKDNDPRVAWNYSQEKGAPKQYAVRIRIEKVQFL